MMRIGIVGTGIAGLTAGWLLRSAGFDVTLFEKNESLGMDAHSFTADFPDSDDPIRIDVPPRMFNESLWPNLCKLYQKLEVEVVPADTTKSYSIIGGNTYLRTDASFRPRLSASWIVNGNVRKILSDTSKMLESAKRDVDSAEQTFGKYLEERAFSDAFVREFLFPTLSATVCTCRYAAIKEYPATVMLRALLSLVGESSEQFDSEAAFNGVKDGTVVDQRTLFRTANGTRDVVARLTGGIDNVRLGTVVREVERSSEQVAVRTTTAETLTFDHVIVATQANAAQHLVKSIPENERLALSSFSYEDVKTIVHSDPSLLPGRESNWAAFNFVSDESRSASMCSIYMNQFLDRVIAQPIFQTIMPIGDAQPEGVLHVSRMQRPVVNQQSMDGLERLRMAHSEPGRRIWYCGSYASPGIPLLEGGVVSALEVARRFGVDWPQSVQPAMA